MRGNVDINRAVKRDYIDCIIITSLFILCVLILYISNSTYSLKLTPNDRFFEKLFMKILFTLRVFARNLLRGNERKNTFYILC